MEEPGLKPGTPILDASVPSSDLTAAPNVCPVSFLDYSVFSYRKKGVSSGTDDFFKDKFKRILGIIFPKPVAHDWQ